MRQTKRFIDIPLPQEKVWAWFEDMKNWDMLLAAFIGKKSGVHHQPVSVPGAGADGTTGAKGAGMQVSVADRRGNEILRWTVTEWSPPRLLSVSGQVQGGLTGFQMLMTWELGSPVAGSTRVDMGLSLILHNVLLELITLLLPLRFLYSYRLARCLKAIRTDLTG